MTDDETPEPRLLSEFLDLHRGGALDVEAGAALAEVAAAVQALDKKGKLTITILVNPMKMGYAVEVSDTLKADVPEERGGSIFFVDDEGLTRDDPQQSLLVTMSESAEMETQGVDPNTGEIIDMTIRRTSTGE